MPSHCCLVCEQVLPEDNQKSLVENYFTNIVMAAHGQIPVPSPPALPSPDVPVPCTTLLDPVTMGLEPLNTLVSGMVGLAHAVPLGKGPEGLRSVPGVPLGIVKASPEGSEPIPPDGDTNLTPPRE